MIRPPEVEVGGHVASPGMDVAAVPLTSLSHGAGCGCKLPASALLPIVRGLPAATAPELLVGSATGDDAAVWRVSDELALVQTVDFFTPVVDDPYDFRRPAARAARRLLPPGRRRPLRLRPHRRGQRAVGRLREGRPPADGAQPG